MGVKHGRSHWGRNIRRVWLRIRCWEYLGSGGTRWQGSWENYIPNIVRLIKTRMRWAGHVARMGERRGIYRVLVGKPEGKWPLYLLYYCEGISVYVIFFPDFFIIPRFLILCCIQNVKFQYLFCVSFMNVLLFSIARNIVLVVLIISHGCPFLSVGYSVWRAPWT